MDLRHVVQDSIIYFQFIKKVKRPKNWNRFKIVKKSFACLKIIFLTFEF